MKQTWKTFNYAFLHFIYLLWTVSLSSSVDRTWTLHPYQRYRPLQKPRELLHNYMKNTLAFLSSYLSSCFYVCTNKYQCAGIFLSSNYSFFKSEQVHHTTSVWNWTAIVTAPLLSLANIPLSFVGVVLLLSWVCQPLLPTVFYVPGPPGVDGEASSTGPGDVSR